MAYILLVEDDPIFREMLSKMLQADHHQVAAAADGEAALALFARQRPDLILTDILMPHMDGIALLGELRRLGSTTPVIAMSGGRRSISADFNLTSASLMGVRASLQKPFTRQDLRDAVSAVLAGRGQPAG